MRTLKNQRVLVTGANGGLGLATCIAALKEGAHVVLACRSADKAASAQARAVAAAGVPTARALAAGGFDMLDPSAIDRAVAALPNEPLDVVFLQAGGWVVADEAQHVVLGGRRVERTLAQNVVGAHATLRALMASGRLAPHGRVVIVGGEGARGVPRAIRKPTFADLAHFERALAGVPGPYVPIDALGVAKLCAALWAQHLARHTDDLEVVWFTPGLIGGTRGTAGLPALQEFIVQRIAFPLFVALGRAQWPATAAAKCVDCLAGRVGRHGDLLGAPEGAALGPLTDQKPMNPHFTDPRMQRAVWDLCEAAAGALPLALAERHRA
ncbi:MAG: SDR family oxidoreductase [Myxococcota bacterium]